MYERLNVHDGSRVGKVGRMNDAATPSTPRSAGPGELFDAGTKEPEKEKVFSSAGPVWSVIIGFLVAAAVVAFITQNTHAVKVNFLWMHGNTSLAVIVLVVTFAAVVIDELAGLALRFRRRRMLNEREELKRLRKKD